MRLVGTFDNINGESERDLTVKFLEQHGCSEVVVTPGEEGLNYEYVQYVACAEDACDVLAVCLFALGATAKELAAARVYVEYGERGGVTFGGF